MLQIKLLFMLGLILTLGIDSQTTLPSSIMDRAVADLGDRLSISLHEAGVKRVVVLDLLGAQKEIHPVGTWLADQLSSALQRNSANLEVVDRSKARGPTETDENSPENGAPGKKEIDIARSVGADGNHAKYSECFPFPTIYTVGSRSGAHLGRDQRLICGPHSILQWGCVPSRHRRNYESCLYLLPPARV
jgi:hypothetical protein